MTSAVFVIVPTAELIELDNNIFILVATFLSLFLKTLRNPFLKPMYEKYVVMPIKILGTIDTIGL